MQREIIKKVPDKKTGKTPLLFVHGAWHGGWCWEKYFLPYFADKGYPSYAVSLSNHGGSAGKKRLNVTLISDYVNDIREVVSGMEEKPVLIGHSMGGLVVQKYLERERVPAAVLMAPVPVSGALKVTLKIARTNPKEFLFTNLTWNMYRIIGREELAVRYLFGENMDPAAVSEFFPRLQNESYLAYVLGMIFPRIKRGKQGNVPMLLLGASNDEIFSVKEIEKTAAFHDAQCEILPGMAHDMMLDPGWKDAADRIVRFLEHN